MDEEMIDLRDRRGRLARLGIACAVGATVTVAVMLGISAVGVKTNPDSISQVMPVLMAVAIFVLTTRGAHGVVAARHRRRRERRRS